MKSLGLSKIFADVSALAVPCARGELKRAFINKTANIHPDSKIMIRISTSPQPFQKPLQ